MEGAVGVPISTNINYEHELDVCLIQDLQVYNYWPPAAISNSTLVATNIPSTVVGIAGRDVRCYLPRGYSQNLWKHYPVFYFQDGQAVYYIPGSTGSWNIDLTADWEILHGRMQESILVAIDNTPQRLAEYLPPGDSLVFGGTTYNGIADDYVAYITNDVMPVINANFRTLTEPEHTAVVGSSMGGLFSAYAGTFSNVFGKVGAMSSSFWAADNFRAQLLGGGKQIEKFYLDWGSSEDSSIWDYNQEMYFATLAKSYALQDDFFRLIGCGHGHHGSAWRARIPDVFKFLMPTEQEPQYLAVAEYPPVLNLEQSLEKLMWGALRGFDYTVQVSDDLMSGMWIDVYTGRVDAVAWDEIDMSPYVGATNAFYRIEVK